MKRDLAHRKHTNKSQLFERRFGDVLINTLKPEIHIILKNKVLYHLSMHGNDIQRVNFGIYIYNSLHRSTKVILKTSYTHAK
jgi:hypothetical protein